MYHYTECGLQKVWLENGYSVTNTPYGKGISIRDVAGLHRLIGRTIAYRPKLTGTELRFLRKEMELSQKGLANMVGVTEQNVSLWERQGKIPRYASRLVKLLYLGHVEGNVKVSEIIQNFIDQDEDGQDNLRFRAQGGHWKEAA